MLIQIHTEHHEGVEDTDRQEFESGHSDSRRARAWRRGSTERGYLDPWFGTVKKPYIVQLQSQSKNPGCQTIGSNFARFDCVFPAE